MPLIKWSESYSVGGDQFDHSHARLVEMINSMFNIVREYE